MAEPTEPAVASPAAPSPATETAATPQAAPPVSPVTEPAAPAASSSEPAAQPVAEPAKPAEPAAEVAKPDAVKPHTDTPTLLEEPVKPAEATVDAAKPEDAKPADAPARTYEPFKLPEGIAPDTEKMSEYNKVLAKHNLSQEVGQDLIDMHSASLQAYANHLSGEQHRVFADTRKGWRTEVMADPELGGAGHNTAMGAIARARDMLVPPARQKAFNDMLRITGVGDHPEFLRLLHAAAQRFDEPPPPPPGARPAPNNGKPPKRGMGAIYDKTDFNQGR